jgi:hypothetical protein
MELGSYADWHNETDYSIMYKLYQLA